MSADPDERDDHPDSVRDLLSGERLRRLIREEPGLWPVVTTIAIVALTIATALLYVALEGRNLAAAGAVAGMLGITMMAVDGNRRRAGRFGATLWVALGFWLVATTSALALSHWLAS